jgi:nitrate reductase NapE component
MPSADFCLFPLHVAMKGASGFLVITLTILI